LDVRFWGKMLTRGKDYYIVETFLDQEYPDKVDTDTEARG